MTTEDGRRQNVIHQSLTRPILLAGAERPLAISNWIIAAALILGAGQWFTVIGGVLLAIFGHWVLVELAKIDPQLSQIYRRHLRHRQAYYPARASIWAPPPERVRPTVPTSKQMKG
jgi:type IV secretion system protein VirB3